MTKKRRLRIASYNINGINSRLGVLTRWLDEFRPDIVGLQELKCTDEAFPNEVIRGLGYSAIWHGQRAWNGVAISEPGRGPGGNPASASERSEPRAEPLP